MEDEFPLTAETLESIGRGLAQADAGLLIDGDEVLAELYAAVGLPDPPTINRERESLIAAVNAALDDPDPGMTPEEADRKLLEELPWLKERRKEIADGL